MKIGATSRYCGNYPVFQGLYGSEEVRTIGAYYNTNRGIKYFGDSTSIIKKCYHPFLNETEEQTQKAKNELLSKNVHDRKIGGRLTHHVYYEFILKEKIPVTEQMYQAYIEKKLVPEMDLLVKNKLIKAGLSMFLKK